MQKAKRPLHADDLPPSLCWESGIWWLYLRVQTQWRMGPSGARSGLDYSPVIALVKDQGWDLTRSLTLLQAVEMTALEVQAASNE